MKFLIDMNLSPLSGAVHWSTVGPPAAPDSNLGFRRGQRLDRFYARSGLRHAAGHLADKPSRIIQVRCQDVLPCAIGDIVLRAIRMAERRLEAGSLVTVDPFRHRIRLLAI
jgi:hypothetical protein